MRTIYHYVGNDPDAFRKGYQEVVRSEFYRGHIAPLKATTIDLILRRILVDSMYVMSLRSDAAVKFSRTASDTADEVDVCMAWLIRDGNVRIGQKKTVRRAGPGSCLIVKSSRSFFAEIEVSDLGVHKSVQIIMPAHIQKAYGITLDDSEPFKIVSRLPRRTRNLAGDLFEHLSRPTQFLPSVVLSELKQYLAEISSDEELARGGSSQDPWLAVGQFMERRHHEADLSAAFVAGECGMSRRQLFYLFKSNGLSFSDVLWTLRLSKARHLLVNSARHELSIERISGLAGFKSPAHFSGRFKRHYGYAPGSIRKTG